MSHNWGEALLSSESDQFTGGASMMYKSWNSQWNQNTLLKSKFGISYLYFAGFSLILTILSFKFKGLNFSWISSFNLFTMLLHISFKHAGNDGYSNRFHIPWPFQFSDNVSPDFISLSDETVPSWRKSFLCSQRWNLVSHPKLSFLLTFQLLEEFCFISSLKKLRVCVYNISIFSFVKSQSFSYFSEDFSS